jgi:dihydrofolate reductase
VFRDFADIWRAAEKIVYSRTLSVAGSTRTRVERAFDPDGVRRLKLSSTADISIGGGEVARQAIGAGLVDECHLFFCPIVVGGGKRMLPDNARTQLELLDEHRFKSGVVHLHYRVDV